MPPAAVIVAPIQAVNTQKQAIVTGTLRARSKMAVAAQESGAATITTWRVRRRLVYTKLMLAPEVALTTQECERWLDNEHIIPDDDPIFRSELKMDLQLAPLARAVGNSRSKELELLEPIGEAVVLTAATTPTPVALGAGCYTKPP